MRNKVGKGISFDKETIILVDSNRKTNEDFSACVNRLLRKEHLENTLDTAILKKMIPVFIKKSIKVSLEDEEVKRIEELHKK